MPWAAEGFPLAAHVPQNPKTRLTSGQQSVQRLLWHILALCIRVLGSDGSERIKVEGRTPLSHFSPRHPSMGRGAGLTPQITSAYSWHFSKTITSHIAGPSLEPTGLGEHHGTQSPAGEHHEHQPPRPFALWHVKPKGASIMSITRPSSLRRKTQQARIMSISCPRRLGFLALCQAKPNRRAPSEHHEHQPLRPLPHVKPSRRAS